CAPFIASQLPKYSPFKIEEGRPFWAVLARDGALRAPVRALSWERSRRAGDCRRPPLASAIVYPIAPPNRATLHHLAALQLDGANRCCNAGILVARVEDARRASRSIGKQRGRVTRLWG